MKKLIVLVLFLVVSIFAFQGTSNALVGTPDDVPGTDILVPFFMASMPGHGNDNTLLTITEVKGVATNLFFWVNDIDSVVQWDDNPDLTPFDVYSTDALSLIAMMPIGAKAALEVDLDGDGTNDHWAGYIYYFNNTTLIENLISNAYQVALPQGMAAGYNPVSMENNNAADVRQIGVFGDEAYSANSLLIGEDLLGGFAPGLSAIEFRLMPRYYINDANSGNKLILWTESNFTGTALPGLLHVNFFDEDENAQSSNILVDHELNIIDIPNIIPPGLFPAGYPYAGWVDIATPDIFGAGWFTNANANLEWDGAERYWLGYSYQQAIGAGALTWDVIHTVHRTAN